MDKFVSRKSTASSSGDTPTSLGLQSTASSSGDTPTSLGLQSTASSSGDTPTSLGLPNDICGDEIRQPKRQSYPKNAQGRCFRSDWFAKCPWLEYSIERDAAFCYPCRRFGMRHSTEKEMAFTKYGFRAWKQAFGDKTKGLCLHESSVAHINAMAAWGEHKHRISSGTSVSTLVGASVLEKNRYYVRSIAEVIQFLAVNELPFRGDESDTGVFRNLFEYTLVKDSKLADIAKTIPANATYLSPGIQNEIIGTMASVVRDSVVDDVNDSELPRYSLLVDGTKDKNLVENLSVAIRFVKGAKTFECLLAMPSSEKLDANSMTDIILETLDGCGLESRNLVAQCYDGASSMSGRHGGVQKLIQNRLDRCIPYVHCFNHRLHLVVVDIVASIGDLGQFFEQCSMVYNFFRKSKVAAVYGGTKLKPVLQTRWTGHYDTIVRILQNHSNIIDTLADVENSPDFDGETIAQAGGIRILLLRRKFVAPAVIMRRILGIMAPVDKQLQSRNSQLNTALSLVATAAGLIRDLRSDEQYQSVLDDINQFADEEPDIDTSKRRRRAPSKRLGDSVVLSSTGQRQPIDDDTWKRLYYEVIDEVLAGVCFFNGLSRWSSPTPRNVPSPTPPTPIAPCLSTATSTHLLVALTAIGAIRYVIHKLFSKV